jgi:hypothetical protein
MGQNQMTPTSLTSNVTPLNDVLMNLNFTKFTVRLEDYIILSGVTFGVKL